MNASAHRPFELACVVLLVACGPSVRDEVDLEDVCGEAGPVQILALDDNEAVMWGPQAATQVDGRWLVVVQRFDRDVVDIGPASATGPYRVIPQVDTRVESVDPCGGDRRIVAEGIDSIMPPAQDGRPWLGEHIDTRALFVFDPSGGFAAQELARGRLVAWVEGEPASAVVHRTQERDIVSFAIDGGDIVPRVVATSVAQTRRGLADPQRALLVLHDDGGLVEIDLATGDTESIAQGVRSFSQDDERRFIVWSPGDPAAPDEPLPTESILFDRATGASRTLASGVPLFGQIIGNVAVVHEHPEAGPVRSTFVLLPGGETLTLEGRWHAFGGYWADRVVVHGGEPAPWPPEMFVYAPSEGQLRQVAGPVPATKGTRDALWYGDVEPYAEEPTGTPYDLVRFSLADLTTEVVARRVRSQVELPGDRWLSVLVPQEEVIGDLVALDDSDGAAHEIDRDVAPAITAFEPDMARFPYPRQADSIIYQVRDPGSGRTGLWRADFGDG